MVTGCGLVSYFLEEGPISGSHEESNDPFRSEIKGGQFLDNLYVFYILKHCFICISLRKLYIDIMDHRGLAKQLL
jgi:hypothetical protein